MILIRREMRSLLILPFAGFWNNMSPSLQGYMCLQLHHNPGPRGHEVVSSLCFLRFAGGVKIRESAVFIVMFIIPSLCWIPEQNVALILKGTAALQCDLISKIMITIRPQCHEVFYSVPSVLFTICRWQVVFVCLRKCSFHLFF